MEEKTVSVQTLRRLPIYLHFLRSNRDLYPSISATILAERLGLNDVQVRKDLGSVSGSGRPKTGYNTSELIDQMEVYLGYRTKRRAVLVGAGNLGKALMSYSGFEDYGLEIVAAFDENPALVGGVIGKTPIRPMSELTAVCSSLRIHIGIITVPASSAQLVAEELVTNGVSAIWNFAPTILRVSEHVRVENENLASSLAVLSRHLHVDNNADAES